MTVTFMTS